MHLGKASACGVFAAVHLATQQEGAAIVAEDLAESCGFAVEELTAVLEKLEQARIVGRDSAPPHGFALNKPPGQITLLQIVEAIEGKEEADLMLPVSSGSKDVFPCAPESLLKAVGSIAADLLKTRTIEDLVNSEQ